MPCLNPPQREVHSVKLLEPLAPPLSFYCRAANLRPGLLLGYTGVSEEEIRCGVHRLRQALSSARA